jgi:bifunctional non-homologous end joining protein LigD
MVTGGWTAVADEQGLRVGSLLVGPYNDTGVLVYCGQVSSGLTERMRRALGSQLAEIRWSRSPFSGSPPVSADSSVNWVKPLLVVEVDYREFTGRLRHPSLKGLADIAPERVTLPAMQ